MLAASASRRKGRGASTTWTARPTSRSSLLMGHCSLLGFGGAASESTMPIKGGSFVRIYAAEVCGGQFQILLSHLTNDSLPIQVCRLLFTL
uniref:Uncharacterized protein n=1 Tax=Arundo donax TaxID=35708 RepID=A0A0A9CW17_ARUDO